MSENEPLNRELDFHMDRLERVMASRRWPARINREDIQVSKDGDIISLKLKAVEEVFGDFKVVSQNYELLNEMASAIGREDGCVKMEETEGEWRLVVSSKPFKRNEIKNS